MTDKCYIHGILTITVRQPFAAIARAIGAQERQSTNPPRVGNKYPPAVKQIAAAT